MRAYRLTTGGGIDGLRVIDAADLQPGPGEVLIRVRATSLNYRDLGIVRASRQEVVPLSDGAGEVLAVGAGVTAFVPGELVAGCFFRSWPDGDVRAEYTAEALGGAIDGMLAEQVVLPASAVVHAPAHMTVEEAAALPCAALTAWNAMFEEARLRPGQTVLLLGTGGVSIAGLQLARLAGVRSIITSSSNAKLDRARALGADETINYIEHPEWEQEVLRLTGGAGVDLVLEVGGVTTYAQSVASTRLGGSVVMIGGVGGRPSDQVPMLTRNVHVSRVFVGSRVMFERMNAALALRQVHPVVDRVFAFEQAPEAYRYLESQAHVGKVVVRV